MTEGIIQKVFQHYWDKNDSSAKAVYDLQQELIAEIKKIVECHCTHSLGVCQECRLLGKVLIGDTE